jgi:hypothetical protein
MGAVVAEISLAFAHILVEGDAESLLDFADGTSHHDGAPSQAGGAFVHGKAALVRKFAQLVEAGGIGTVLVGEFLLANVPASQRFEIEGVFALYDDRNTDDALSVALPGDGFARSCPAYAFRERYSGLALLILQ